MTERRLSAALAAIGWRAASDEPAESVARELAGIVRAGVRGHRDLARLRREIAECLRRHAHHLDGSSAAPGAWEPAATDVLARYAQRQQATG